MDFKVIVVMFEFDSHSKQEIILSLFALLGNGEHYTILLYYSPSTLIFLSFNDIDFNGSYCIYQRSQHINEPNGSFCVVLTH